LESRLEIRNAIDGDEHPGVHLPVLRGAVLRGVPVPWVGQRRGLAAQLLLGGARARGGRHQAGARDRHLPGAGPQAHPAAVRLGASPRVLHPRQRQFWRQAAAQGHVFRFNKSGAQDLEFFLKPSKSKAKRSIISIDPISILVSIYG